MFQFKTSNMILNYKSSRNFLSPTNLKCFIFYLPPFHEYWICFMRIELCFIYTYFKWKFNEFNGLSLCQNLNSHKKIIMNHKKLKIFGDAFGIVKKCMNRVIGITVFGQNIYNLSYENFEKNVYFQSPIFSFKIIIFFFFYFCQIKIIFQLIDGKYYKFLATSRLEYWLDNY